MKLKVRQLGIIQQTLFAKTPRESSAILEFVNVAISSAQGLQRHNVGVALVSTTLISPRSLAMTKNRLASHHSSAESYLGKILVATPRVAEGSPFSRAVILVLQDSKEGIFGVVLNRPASPDMLYAWQQVADRPSFADEKLVAGGPVHGPILAIHSERKLAEIEIAGGVFVSVQKEAIVKLSEMETAKTDSPFRIVLGAVSWESDDLKKEIDLGAWFVVDSEPNQIFSDPALMWERSVQRFGNESIMKLTGIQNFPANPLLN